MNEDRLELLLRETFAQDADTAPPPAGLAGAARGRLRRRRRRTGAAAAAGVAVLAVAGGLAWDAARPSAGPAPADRGEVRLEPAPPPAPSGSYLPDEERAIAPLRRPLRLPAATAGSCPVSGTRQLPAGAGFNTPFTATGDGPFFLSGPPEVQVPPAEPGSALEGTGWRDAKVIWAVEGRYTGPLLIRGARIDAPGELGFVRYLGALGQGPDPKYDELAYAAVPDGELRSYPSGVWVREAGCYAVQVDGVSFTEVIVFRVTLS